MNTKSPPPLRADAVIPLRQRKYARTRLDLLAALTARMDTRALEEISVRELCEAASISEASFFNYFPRKTDLVAYFIQMWSLRVGGHVARATARGGARDGIDAIFAVTAEQVAEHPRVMAEVIAFQARLQGKLPLGEVTLAERLLAFPDLPEALEASVLGLDGHLLALLDRAVKDGALPPGTDREMAMLLLASVFFGVPMLLGPRTPRAIGPAYRAAVETVWKGLSTPPSTSRARSPSRPRRR